MIKQRRINLNLATNPLRNRRLFYLFTLSLGLIILLLFLSAGSIYFSYKSKIKKIDSSVMKIDQSIRNAQGKARQYTNRIENTAKENKGKVDLINSLIFRKSFSWIDFLYCLEDSLPDSSYIVSLAPTLTEDLKMKVRFGVVSRSLDDLLKLINNLEKLKFKQIKVLNEAKNERGSLRAEISLTYERNI